MANRSFGKWLRQWFIWSKMRILVVASYYKPAYIYGGPVKSISQLCEALVQRGNHVTVLTTNANGETALNVQVNHIVNVDGVEVSYMERSPWAPRRYFYAPNMGEVCERFMPSTDVLYICATWTYPMIPAARIAGKFHKPYIMSPRGDLMEWSLQQKSIKKKIYLRLIEKRLIRDAAAIHCTSQDEMEQYQRLNFQSPAFIVPNGVDLTQFSALPARGALRKKLGISDSAAISLFVGRLHKMKGLDRAVTEFASVARARTDTHLIVAGLDEDGSGVFAQEQVKQLDLQERVHFLGALYGNDLLQAYADSDLFVLLSHRENFGMAVVEAMASGLPVLLSGEVALSSDITKYRAGIVVDVKKESVAQSWLELLNDKNKREELRHNGMRLAREKFSSDKIAEQMEKVFDKIARRQPV
jgi:glycosyltransferase involved in cell wall biosynthesis